MVFRRLIQHGTLRATLSEEPAVDRQIVSKVLTEVVQAGFLGDRDQLFVGPRAKQIQIHLTNRCNLRCIHCYMDSGIRQVAERPTADWLRLLDALVERYPSSFVAVSGGEPLLSRSLFPLLERARDRGIKTAILTNGLRLDQATVRRLNPLLEVCAISFDGLSSETHDHIRGEGSFSVTYRNLFNLAESPFRKVLNITVLQSNKEELVARLRDFVDRLPFKVDIDLGSVVPEGRAVDNPQLAMPPNEFRDVLLHIARQFVSEQLGGERRIGTDGTVLWKSVPPRVRQSCGYGDTLVIYSNGDVSTCLTPRFIRGNIFHGDPGELLDQIEVERAATRVDRLEECKTCDLRHICGGRCHLAQLRAGQMPSQVECPDTYKQSMFRNLARWYSSA
jgi:radical SAM protein with 4Fe4S-binding SPASM domain